MSHFGFASRNDEIPKSVVQVKKAEKGLPERKFRELGIDQVLKTKYHFNNIQAKRQSHIDQDLFAFHRIFSAMLCAGQKMIKQVLQKG